MKKSSMKTLDEVLNQTITREEVYASDRGEREYYNSRAKTKSEAKQRMKIPVTTDGCLAILEMVTTSMDVPLDETVIQIFNGYIHHLPQTENSFTFDDLMKLIHNHMSKSVTWKLDQDVKERRQTEARAKAQLTVVESTDAKEEATTEAPEHAPQ